MGKLDPEDVVVVSGSPDLSEVTKAKLTSDVEKAKRAQKQLLDRRKKKPTGVQMGQIYSSPRKELIARLVPEAIPTPLKRGMKRNPALLNAGATWYVIFDDPSKHNKHIAEGYEPVMEDGMHVATAGGDLMYKIPIELVQDKHKLAEDLNYSRIKKDTEKEFNESATSDGILENVTEVRR